MSLTHAMRLKMSQMYTVIIGKVMDCIFEEDILLQHIRKTLNNHEKCSQFYAILIKSGVQCLQDLSYWQDGEIPEIPIVFFKKIMNIKFVEESPTVVENVGTVDEFHDQTSGYTSSSSHITLTACSSIRNDDSIFDTHISGHNNSNALPNLALNTSEVTESEKMDKFFHLLPLAVQSRIKAGIRLNKIQMLQAVRCAVDIVKKYNGDIAKRPAMEWWARP